MCSTPLTPRPASSSRASSRAGSRDAVRQGRSRSGRQAGAQLRAREAAVRAAVLLLARALRHRPPVAPDDEDRVVAEAPLAPRRVADLAEHRAVEELALAIRRAQRRHAHEARAPVRHAVEQREELRVALVGRSVLAEEPPAADAGRATQVEHLEPGVVRDRQEAARPCVRARLRLRVLRERGSGLVGLGRHGREIVRRDELEVEALEDLAVLAQLAGIGGADEEPLPVLAHTSAARWAVTSSAIPSRESASTRSKSSRVNGRPSAVPCTSMSSPSLVATTFTSASAIESSAYARSRRSSPPMKPADTAAT